MDQKERDWLRTLKSCKARVVRVEKNGPEPSDRSFKAWKQELKAEKSQYRKAQLQVAHDIKAHWAEKIIRRTGASLDNHGVRISNLPPIHIVDAIVELTDEETFAVQSIATRAIENGDSAAIPESLNSVSPSIFRAG